MKKLIYVFQIILKLSLVFLIAFIWLRFLLSSIWWTLGISLIITVSFEIIHRYLQKKTSSKQSLKIKEKEDADNMFFSLLTDKNYMQFFENMLSSRHNNITSKKTYLIVNKEDKKTVFFPFINLEILKPNHIVEILRNCQNFQSG